MTLNSLQPVIGLLLVLSSALSAPAQVTRLTPTNLKSLNTPGNEDDPCLSISKKGNVRRLYFVSDAPGRPTLMVSELNDRGSWDKGVPVQGPDPEIENRCPCLSTDGHDLFFAANIVFHDSTKAESNFEIVHSVRLTAAEQYTAPTPVHSVCTEADEMHPWLTADGRALYFSRKTKEGWRIFVAKRESGSGVFEAPTLIEAIPPGFQHATVTHDGRTMFLQGSVANGRSGLFRVKQVRAGSSWRWGAPEELVNLNCTAEEGKTGDMAPSVSRDDLKLYFVSDRKGGKGGRDIWLVNAPSLIFGSIGR
jgi:hypothetical protein